VRKDHATQIVALARSSQEWLDFVIEGAKQLRATLDKEAVGEGDLELIISRARVLCIALLGEEE